jgi:VWFA-related protein
MAQDVRADLPSNNILRIENRRGSVEVEVWDEQHVSVTASFEGQTPPTSPVIVRRTESLLNVLVAGGATREASSIRVNLTLRIPRRAKVQIVTTSGAVEVRGLPGQLSVETGSGNIRTMFPAASDADITIAAPREQLDVNFSMASAPSKDRKTSRFRAGKGTTAVRLKSAQGRIALDEWKASTPVARNDEASAAKATAESLEPAEQETQEKPSGPAKPPTLIGSTTGNSGAGTPAQATGGEPQEIDDGDVVRVDTELVTLNVSVIDRGTNRGLVGLTQADFKIFEDGSEQKIGHFESSAAPFNLILVIDISGSTRDKVRLIRSAAQRFVDAARPYDRIAVISFAGTAQVVSRLTTNRAQLTQRLGQIENAVGDTKLYDSLSFAMKPLTTDAAKDAATSGRTAIVLMSDGLDGSLPSVHGTGSALGYNELLGEVREFDGVLYTLWVDTEYESLSEKDTQPEDFDAGHDRMEAMAEAGGGLFYEVGKLEDLAGAYERVVADIGTVYSLSYRPTNTLRDGKWRAINVKVARPDGVARHKRGYYAK